MQANAFSRGTSFRHWALAAITALSLLIAVLRVTEPFDLRVLDAQFRLLRDWRPQPSATVAVVGIDHDSLERIAEPFALWHRHIGQFLSGLVAAEPAVVGIDVVLPDRSFDAVVPGLDKALLKGILDAQRAYPFVLALTVDPSGGTRKVHPPFVSLAGAAGTGYALFPLDADGVVRRFHEQIGEDDGFVSTLAGQMARRLGKPVHGGYIDYARGSVFEYIPFHRVMEWHERNDSQAVRNAFHGKPVLLGFIDRFSDRLATPVQLAAWESASRDTAGVLVNAQVLRNLLDRGLAQRIGQHWITAAGALGALTFLISMGSIAIAALAAVLLGALFALSTWFLADGVFVPTGAVAASIILGLGVRHAWDTAERLVERRRLRASFGGYVSPSVMQEILSGQLRPELGGVEKFVCILFSDIRGYTTRTEGMTAPQVLAFLNRYFDQVVTTIHAHDGAVICFMGDGIMAAFGATKPLANPCQNAFDAARGLLANVAQINEQFITEGQKPIDIGVGLHAGIAVVGHIGSRDRHDYSAVGDVTNVASRLESLTKEEGYRLIVSSVVAERLSREPGLVDLGALNVRGHTPVKALGYAPVGGGRG